MKKAIGQTVRDIKRGVNKKVLKVPSIEQKVLDATSNEPWGPHGSHLADIAQASRNYHEFQMIMSTLWKRINDTGKNWRHVYKALTVLEYLVANGSERIIEEIREHAYQISTLSDFQYIDSAGRDQGTNVRKKSESLVALVNDKERIQEVRQKAAANRDKFHNTSGGGMYRPGGYDDNRYEGRYGSREEERYGYGREREWGDGRYGDRYGEEYRARSRSVDGDNYASRSRSSDGDGERSYEDDGQYSRDSNAKADDQSQDGSVGGRPDKRFSEQNLEVPPSYEDAVGEGRSPVHSERNGETAAASVPTSSSPPPISTSHQETTAVSGGSPDPTPAPPPPPPPAATHSPPAATSGKENDGFDEFDPRGSFPGASSTSGGAEMDLLGSLSDSFYSNSMALVPSTTTTSEPDSFTNSNPGQSQTFVATSSTSDTQPFEDPFGDGPFRAIPSTDEFSAQPQSTNGEPPQPVAPISGEPPQPFGPTSHEPPQPVSPIPDSGNSFGFSHTFDPSTDILADLLPPPEPSQPGFQGQPDQLPTQSGYISQPSQGFAAQQNQPVIPSSFPGQLSHNGQPLPQQYGFAPQNGQNTPFGGFPPQMGSVPHPGFFSSNGQSAQPSNFYGGFEQQGSSAPVPPQYNASNFYHQPQVQPTMTASTGALAIVPQQPSNEKFETKSTVWADTLNRGLVNLNISGPKTNPLSNIGIDFEAMNRKDKRMEKPSPNPVTSNVTMGKAMGSGSGIGRAGASALRAPPGPMMPGAGATPGYGAGYGALNQGYGALNHQPMGMNNMGMGQGFQMQQPPAGFPPGPPMAGNYNPMMGQGGGYGQQPPYGSGYR